MIREEGVRYLTIELIQRLDRLEPFERIKCIDEIVEALNQRKEKLERSYEHA